MRAWPFLSVGLLVGCTATPPAPRHDSPSGQPELVQLEDRSEAAPEGALTGALPRASATAAVAQAANDGTDEALQTHRARRFYLQGVHFLQQPPDVDAAIREFQLALEMDPRFYKAHFKLGICYYHKGQYELEITEYLKCLAINRNYAPAWLNLGHAYLARDELELARDAYQEVLNLQPDHRIALYNLGLVEFDLRLPEARERLERFLEVDGQGEMGQRARQYLDELRQREEGAR